MTIICKLLLLVCLCTSASSQVIDMGTGLPVEGQWFESGSVDIGTADWVSVTASLTNYNNPVVFLRF